MKHKILFNISLILIISSIYTYSEVEKPLVSLDFCVFLWPKQSSPYYHEVLSNIPDENGAIGKPGDTQTIRQFLYSSGIEESNKTAKLKDGQLSDWYHYTGPSDMYFFVMKSAGE